MKRISIKGATWDSMFLAFAKGLTLLFGILSAKILSVGLTLEEYGTYSQANLIMTTGTSIILFGLGDALAYYFNGKNNDKNNGSKTSVQTKAIIINTIFFIEIVLGLIMAAAIVGGQGLIADYFSNPKVQELMWVVALLPMFANVQYFMQVMCISIGRAKWMSFYSLVFTVIRIIAVYLSVYVFYNILWIYVAILLMDILQMAVFNWDLRRENVKINPFKISFKYFKPIISYGLPMGIYALTSSFTRELGKIVIGGLGNTEELAIYTNCSKVLPLDFFVTSFAVVLIPYIYRRVSEGRRDESVELFSSYMKVGYYTVWTLGAMVLVAPSTIISFLYADQYVVGTGVFIIFIFDSMIRFANVHLILTAAGKAKNVMIYSVVSLALNLALNVAFYMMWGMIGPAIATLIVAVVYMLLILSDTTRTIQTKWKEIFDIKDLSIFTVSIIIAWFATFMLNKLLVGWGVHAYVSMIISMAVFGISIMAMHFKRIFGTLKKINSFKL